MYMYIYIYKYTAYTTARIYTSIIILKTPSQSPKVQIQNSDVLQDMIIGGVLSTRIGIIHSPSAVL